MGTIQPHRINMKRKPTPEELARYRAMNQAAMDMALYAKEKGYDAELTYMAAFRLAVQLAIMHGKSMHDIMGINMHYCKKTIEALEELEDEE